MNTLIKGNHLTKLYTLYKFPSNRSFFKSKSIMPPKRKAQVVPEEHEEGSPERPVRALRSRIKQLPNNQPNAEISSTTHEMSKAEAETNGETKVKDQAKPMKQAKLKDYTKQPAKPKNPVKSTKPKEPVKSTESKEPVKSTEPKEPVKSTEPKEPVKSTEPKEPVKSKKPKEEVKSKKPKEEVKSKKPKADAVNAKEKKVPGTKSKIANRTETEWETIDFDCTKKNAQGESHNFKITSWNIGGVRAWLQKDGLSIIQHDQPDVLCLQEIKCSEKKLPKEVEEVNGYHFYWCPSQKEGYAGVGVLSKTEPINITYGIQDEKLDEDGRCMTLEFETFYLVNVYVPNAGRGLVTLPKRLKWNELFKSFIKSLDEEKPVIICGDMNVAHSEIDLANPKTNKQNAGFTPEERDGMSDFLQSGFVDSFRFLYPDVTDVYTFWSYMSNARAKNVGWRLDYFIVSERLQKNVCDSTMRSQVYGSDHCPITLFITI